MKLNFWLKSLGAVLEFLLSEIYLSCQIYSVSLQYPLSCSTCDEVLKDVDTRILILSHVSSPWMLAVTLWLTRLVFTTQL